MRADNESDCLMLCPTARFLAAIKAGSVAKTADSQPTILSALCLAVRVLLDIEGRRGDT
jgi:hypothetical protein